ncbi:MAG: Cold shock protein 1 [Syntrophus sp. PtaU1.Bin005]|jgi:ribosomal subunit interface protein|uniref:HPF/RaiA family ribosome-associated protein n=1 Tax=Syntrophus TaxID=43773 RepID=UPI0009C6E447|nr:MAG: Cold shock protein 1 [Syntrophus sp. PtaB.Bin138]OPY83287.1 MAG: Cold shock protein 1 [Syntrophus sp. PtaU1.Bin005]
MIIPLQITGHGVDLSEEVRNEITDRANKLDKFYDRIMRCKVVVDEPKKHPHSGRLYSVHIIMTVPGGEIVTRREQNEDLLVAMRDSFAAAQRKLEDFSREQRGDVKIHEKQQRGRIGILFPDQGYGFLVSPEGYDVYFHKNSVVNRDFEKLSLGMEVTFAEEMGDKGPQASSVIVL